jgi:regulator of ribonuclease activity A
MGMVFTTCDICDANEDKLADGTLTVMAPVFMRLGKRRRFYGPAVTLKVFEDNVLVRSALESAGRNRVLVVDGGGSLRCALVGGMLGALAEKNNWAGIIVNGCVRDSFELDVCDTGVCALATHPRKSHKKGEGDSNIRVVIAGVAVNPGDWIYVDPDGILVSTQKLV